MSMQKKKKKAKWRMMDKTDNRQMSFNCVFFFFLWSQCGRFFYAAWKFNWVGLSLLLCSHSFWSKDNKKRTSFFFIFSFFLWVRSWDTQNISRIFLLVLDGPWSPEA